MKILGFVNRYSRGVQTVQDELKANGNGEAEFKLHLVTDFLVIEHISIYDSDNEKKEAKKTEGRGKKPKKEVRKTEETTLRSS